MLWFSAYRTAGVAAVPRRHHGVAGTGSKKAQSIFFPADQTQLELVVGPGRLRPDDLRCLAPSVDHPGSGRRRGIAVDRLVGGAFCHRLGRIFRVSLCPGARTGFLAEPAAVLAPFGSSDRRGNGNLHADWNCFGVSLPLFAWLGHLLVISLFAG